LLALLAQSNLYPVARLLTPYYAFLLPPLLVAAGHERIIKKTWWRAAAFAVFGLAALALIVSPARPLFPVMTLLAKMNHAPERIRTVYSVYRERNDAFAPVRSQLPPGVIILGFGTFDDPETSLWRPFGSRHIVHVCPSDTAEQLKQEGVDYILIKDEMFGKWFPGSLDEWLQRVNGRVVQKFSLNLRAAQGPADWYLVKRSD